MAILDWVTNPLWVGGSLAFIASESWQKTSLPSLQINDLGSFGDYAFGSPDFHLVLDRRRDHLAAEGQVDPYGRRVRTASS